MTTLLESIDALLEGRKQSGSGLEALESRRHE